MQTFDVLIAPGPSSNSVSCFSLPPPPSLPPFSSLPLWGGITQENRKGGLSPACLGGRHERAAGQVWAQLWADVCREQVEETGLPDGGGGCLPSCQEALLPGAGGEAWLGCGRDSGQGLGSSGGRHGQWREPGAGERDRGLASGSSSAADLSCGFQQVVDPFWASVSTSVQMETLLPALPTSQGCCEELMR